MNGGEDLSAVDVQMHCLCRSIDLLLNHIKDEEVLEKVLEEEALQAKHIEEEQYALYLLSQIDVYTQSAGAMATDAI